MKTKCIYLLIISLLMSTVMNAQITHQDIIRMSAQPYIQKGDTISQSKATMLSLPPVNTQSLSMGDVGNTQIQPLASTALDYSRSTEGIPYETTATPTGAFMVNVPFELYQSPDGYTP